MPEHVSGNPQNISPVREVRAHSTFDLSRYIFGTHRFSQYNINFFGETVGADSIPVRSSDVIDSYTLKAPLMQDISKTKEYFMVPRQAILPINWDKIERLPALGDDVVASEVNSTITEFESVVGTFVTLFNSFDTSYSGAGANTRISAFLRLLLFGELFFSQGSLLAATGCHLSSLISFGKGSSNYNASERFSFDRFFDYFVSGLVTEISTSTDPVEVVFTSNGNFEYYILGDGQNDSISIHRFLELARDNHDFSFNFTSVQDTSFDSYITTLLQSFTAFNVGNLTPAGVDIKFSIDRCAAYQLICAHFFSNDHVDYIYSADLWRQNMKSIVKRTLYSSVRWPYFSYNGVETDYDILSNFVVRSVFTQALQDTFAISSSARSFFINLFGWRRSLRYQDYFTGAKTRPLAPGDFSVAVNNNTVDVVNITRNIAFQRLANNVNRIGNRIEDWLTNIIGVKKVEPDYHNPMWLASTRSTVYAVKSENSNNSDVDNLPQVTTSANFNGRDSEYEFTVHADRQCVILGITYYDIRRAYCDGIDRMLQHVDRFDGFIPDMQFIGDQEIHGTELSVLANRNISYTLRNMEYKQVHDEAYGGFVENLPGFAFMYGYERPQDQNGVLTSDNFVISPEFIRSRGDEFDKFYTSLTGFSNASYFHFIVKTYNEVNANRPMVYAPQIL